MIGVALLAAGFTVAGLLLPSPARADPPTIADFVADPSVSGASLSPSGRYLVWVAHDGDRSDIQVRDLQEKTVMVLTGGEARESFGGVYIDWIRWKTDDRLLIGITRMEVRRSGNRDTGDIRSYRYGRSVLSMSRDGTSHIQLKAPDTKDTRPGEVLDLLRNDPDNILMIYRTALGSLDVARVNILTGEAEQTLTGHRRVLDYVTDRDGTVVGRIAYRRVGQIEIMEALEADGSWSEVYRLRRNEIRDLPDYEILGGTGAPGKVYVAVQPEAPEGDNTTAAVHIFDFTSRAMGPAIWQQPAYDVTGILQDADSGELVAGCYWADIYRCDFLDPQDDAVMSGIRRFFGEGWSVSVISQARDGGRWLVRASAPNNPGELFIFHVDERRMEYIDAVYPRLPETALGTMSRIDYTAADGQPLFGYLTRPPGAAPDAVLPLVVMPHGGPEARDYLTYDTWAQFLATRGYQVFQPNFRGSAGMGRAFAQAGYRQWGRRMQDDVTAGVDHLIAAGLAESGRACIVGASYGGYAALQSGASQPDLYRCVISIAGPSDLVTMLRWVWTEAGANSDSYEYWLKAIGDPRDDRAALDAVSPIRAVDDWRLPVLLIHGEADSVVPVSQSRDMERALRRARKDVHLVVMEGAGHSRWLSRDETRVLSEIESFLATHLPVGGAGPAPVVDTPVSAD